MVQFCDSTSHNKAAPNKQNRLCHFQSVWDVILQSSDFSNAANPPVSGNVNATPQFEVVQQSNRRRIVLVLDRSGSMGSNVSVLSTVQQSMGEPRLKYCNTHDIATRKGVARNFQFVSISRVLGRSSNCA